MDHMLAYIDGGSGSLIFQALIATFLGGAFFLRQFWGRIRGFFSGRAKKNQA